jgi:hypothetical protein
MSITGGPSTQPNHPPTHPPIHHAVSPIHHRYGVEADSFYSGEGGPGTSLISRGNIIEFNIISDTNKLTTDSGAIEMLGSGDPNLINWWNNNTIRYNNISHTVGSSSSDGTVHVF